MTVGNKGSSLFQLYKESAIPWVPVIPDHWETKRAKSLFKKMERPVSDSDEVVTCFRDGTVTLRRNRRESGFTESLKEIGYQGIRPGDLVIHAMDAFAGAIGVSDSAGKGTPVYSICTPIREANPYFYARVLREMSRNNWIECLAKGIRERSSDFRFTEFSAQVLPMPRPTNKPPSSGFSTTPTSRSSATSRARSGSSPCWRRSGRPSFTKPSPGAWPLM